MGNMKTNMVNKEVNAPVCTATVNMFVSKFSIEYLELVRNSGRRTADQFSYNVVNGAASCLPPALLMGDISTHSRRLGTENKLTRSQTSVKVIVRSAMNAEVNHKEATTSTQERDQSV